jgi:methionine aminopeptidase
MSAFGLQFAHGLGLALHERPIISRVVSMDHPTEIKEGMVFAIETYCPATDGYSAARLKRKWSSRIEDAASSLCFQQKPFQSLTPTDLQEIVGLKHA